jgi:hypothetical protein
VGWGQDRDTFQADVMMKWIKTEAEISQKVSRNGWSKLWKMSLSRESLDFIL